MVQSQRFTIELEVFPESGTDNVYLDLVEALDDYFNYNKVYTIFPHEALDVSDD